MASIGHHVEVRSSSEVVVRLYKNTRWRDAVDAHQAWCECGWSGPKRTRLWEAQNDATNHQINPKENQQ